MLNVPSLPLFSLFLSQRYIQIFIQRSNQKKVLNKYMQTGCMGYFVLILINLRGYMSCMYAYLLKCLLWIGFFLYYKYIFIHHTHLASLSATRKDLWLPELIIKYLVADASFGNTSQRTQPKLDKKINLYQFRISTIRMDW